MSTKMSSRVRYRPSAREMQARRVDKAAPHSTHSPGWPHLSRTGNCLCLGPCCIGPGGCKCREGCAHTTHEPPPGRN